MRRTYRSRSQAIGVALTLGTVGLVGLKVALVTFVDSLGDGRASPSASVLVLACAIGYWCVCLRLVLSMVQLSPSGVVVRNVWRSRRVRWDDVDRFSGERGIVVMHLRGGEQIAITALSGPNVLVRPKHEFVPRMADRLNADAAEFTREARRSASPLPS